MVDDGIDRANLSEVTLVLNGGLDMTEGKSVGQAFQAAARLLMPLQTQAAGMENMGALGVWMEFNRWLDTGTRCIVRKAKTQEMFDRVCVEAYGYIMVDEGFTEVEAGAHTLFVSFPYLHKDRPKIFNNKKVPLL